MLAKMSHKNQLTLPKKVVERLGFSPDEERYLDVEVQGNTVVMRPVTVTIEEKVTEEQYDKFRAWALHKDEGDVSFDTLEKADQFLERRMRKE